jgi:hypothetical protein
MTSDVFVSHSSKDKTIADAVVAVLESKGVRCWVAPRDILPGADWSESIIDAIHNTKAMVLVFSANANASPQIKREVERAVNNGKPIIPFRIENVVPSKSLEYFISMPHWLDAFTPPVEKHIQYLSDVMTRLLSGLGTPDLEIAGPNVAAAERAETAPVGPPPIPPAPARSKPYGTRLFVLAGMCLAVLALGAVAYVEFAPRATPDQIVQVQAFLQDLGHSEVFATSELDDPTEKAIKAFQADHQMRVDGLVSADLINRMHEAVTAETARREQAIQEQAAKEEAYNRQIDAIKASAVQAEQKAQQAQVEARAAASRGRQEASNARSGAEGHYAGNLGNRTDVQYAGEYSNGKPNGYGVVTVDGGEKDEGHWADGTPDGYGVLTLPSGELYEGVLSHGGSEGYGIISCSHSSACNADWNIYSGEIHASNASGLGVVTTFNGATYYGRLSNNGPRSTAFYEGEGVLVNADGSVSAGEWNHGHLVKPTEKP